MAVISDYNRIPILEQLEEDVRTLIPDVFDDVVVKQPTRDWIDTVKITPRNKSIGYIVDVPGAQPEGIRSQFFGEACAGSYITDYRVGIIGASPLGKHEEPQDVIVPIFQGIFRVVLGNGKRRDSDGNELALGTIPISTNHSGRARVPRITWNLLFVIGFEWTVE